MAEYFLNETDVRAAFEHQRRHRVAQKMARTGLADVSVFDALADQIAEVVNGEHFTSKSQKQDGYESKKV